MRAIVLALGLRFTRAQDVSLRTAELRTLRSTATMREDILEVEPMPRELLEELPELPLLHKALKGANWAHAVWMCVGGTPADCKNLLFQVDSPAQ